MEQLHTETERTKRLIAMGEMAASLAHEIRNPLGSMELFCTLLKKDLQTQPELLYLAEQIHKGIKTLDRVISNSLQFVRNSEPKRREVLDLNEFLAEIAEAAAPRAQQTHAIVQIDHLGAGSVSIDRFQIHQALLNLVLNALDAVESRGAEGKVFVSSHTTDRGEWQLSVEDNGVGIAEEDLSRVFDPFFTRKEKGTGLGLSIVYSIISAHGGMIDVQSQKGKGTTFRIKIPVEGAM